MFSLLVKLLPTVWPFVKEVFTGDQRPRGGKPTTPFVKMSIGFLIILLVSHSFTYDIIKTLYLENQSYKLENAKLAHAASVDGKRMLTLEDENVKLRQSNLTLTQDLATEKAKETYMHTKPNAE